VDTFGYLPRAFLGMADDTDRLEAFEIGRFAAHALSGGDGSVVLGYEGGTTRLGLVPLDAVAGKTRTMPDAFLNAGGNTLSDEGSGYFRRLLRHPPDVFTPFV
jgi:6-phosphofructokinase 1